MDEKNRECKNTSFFTVNCHEFFVDYFIIHIEIPFFILIDLANWPELDRMLNCLILLAIYCEIYELFIVVLRRVQILSHLSIVRSKNAFVQMLKSF